MRPDAPEISFVAVRNMTGMNRKEFAEWLAIPYRTMQDWELGTSPANAGEQVRDWLDKFVAVAKASSQAAKERAEAARNMGPQIYTGTLLYHIR